MVRVVGLMGVALVFAAPVASAQPGAGVVVVVASGDEPPCLDPAEVAAAIARHAALTAEVTSGPREAGSATEVHVGGDEAQLDVRVSRGGRSMTRVYADLPCESIPDVVAAFVASVVEAAPPLAEVPPAAPVAVDDPAAAFDRGFAAARRTQRAELLADAMKPYAAWRYRTAAGLLGAVSVGTGAFILELAHDDQVGDGLVKTSMALGVGSALFGLAAPTNEVANTIYEAGTWASLGTLIVGMGFHDYDLDFDGVRESDELRTPFALIGGGYLVAAAWMTFDQIDDPRPTYGSIVRLRERVRTRARRDALDDAALASIEREFLRSRPRRRYALAPIAACAAAMITTAASDLPDDARNAAFFMAAGQATIMSMMFVIRDPVRKYEGRIRATGLAVTPTTNGAGAVLSLGGRF